MGSGQGPTWCPVDGQAYLGDAVGVSHKGEGSVRNEAWWRGGGVSNGVMGRGCGGGTTLLEARLGKLSAL